MVIDFEGFAISDGSAAEGAAWLWLIAFVLKASRVGSLFLEGAAVEILGSSFRSATSRIAAGREGSFGNGINEFFQKGASDKKGRGAEQSGQAARSLKNLLGMSWDLQTAPGLNEFAARIN